MVRTTTASGTSPASIMSRASSSFRGNPSRIIPAEQYGSSFQNVRIMDIVVSGSISIFSSPVKAAAASWYGDAGFIANSRMYSMNEIWNSRCLLANLRALTDLPLWDGPRNTNLGGGATGGLSAEMYADGSDTKACRYSSVAISYHTFWYLQHTVRQVQRRVVEKEALTVLQSRRRLVVEHRLLEE